MSGESPTNKEKERISKATHAACTQVLAMLLGHESLQSTLLTSAARTALLDGTYANIDSIQNGDLKAKLTKKTMGLDVVHKLLGSKPSRCRFKTCERFSKDVRLVFQNIMLYQCYLKDNSPSLYDATLFETAQRLLQGFEMMYAGELARHVVASSTIAPSPTGSPEPSPPQSSLLSASSFKPPSSAAASKPSQSSSTPSTLSLSEECTTKCHTIVQRIMKYKEHGVSLAAPFFNPVDLGMYVDYKVKIPHRMHLYGVQQKLSTGAYPTVAAFAYDMRLIFANCLVYNSEVLLSAKIREHAVKLMHLLEQQLDQFDQTDATWTGLPHADRWKCHQVIHDVLAHRSHGGVETAQWFKHPIVTYFASPDQAPFNYFKVIKRPMDVGTVTSRLHLGEYRDVASFFGDLRLVFDNCIKYWKTSADGQVYCDAAKTLLATMESSAKTVFGSVVVASLFDSKSSNGSKSHHSSGSSATTMSSNHEKKAAPSAPAASFLSPKESKSSSSKKSSSSSSDPAKSSGSSASRREFADKDKCLKILDILRQHRMRGVMGNDIETAYPFLHAVDITRYPDYVKIVPEPMDFNKIDRKLKSNRYTSMSEFSADVHLIFSNCLKYNSDPVEGADIRTMATTLRDCFVKLYQDMENGREIQQHTHVAPTATPGSTSSSSSSKKNRLSSDDDKKRKKDKKEKKKKKDKKKDKKDKKHHHSSSHKTDVVDNAVVVEPAVANTKPSPPPPPPAPVIDLTGSKSSASPTRGSQPAAATTPGVTPATSSSSKPSKASKVKLDLSPWEASCERLVSRMLKLEYVTAMHFDAPLVEKLPDLAKIYKSIISEPMDLGTLRQMLINHAIPDTTEFVRLGRLIFENAKTFNAGPDPASARVRETADHLRWLFDSLSVEMNIMPDSDTLRKQWRNERFSAVQTLKFTESKPNKECVKVLRALLSQKQIKDRWPFMEPAGVLFKDLPPTYYDIVKQPMDLKTVGEKLNSLMYKSYGEFIGDIRLTFENAMLYNQLDKGKDEWTVYGAAKRLYDLTTELWGDVTIDVVERVRRMVMEHKEARVESEKNRAVEKAKAVVDDAVRKKEYEAMLAQQKKDEAEAEAREKAEQAAAREKAAKEARNLQLDKMSKQERKLEDRRRKKEDELAMAERRQRTATVATEEAVREAELRSRLRAKARQIQLQNDLAKEKLLKKGIETKAAKVGMHPVHPMDKQRKRGGPSTTSTSSFWKVKRRKLTVSSVFHMDPDDDDTVHGESAAMAC
ncbi:hypothetical protein, variant [Aphanomyces invadans]|uniref:Bromo domain-containing protein n=1 Tax=Aphanomyces invadans TaxID=157072 RepID=A0A024UDY0_9STRA|nr:hypothetical protein, variant [Aphanomyces invadans]ETW04626.1 hypothetical protein, variant [Aphanomyces invadans]|eukprot:XP_008866063.1 hypothetical protein, variant [Aphanomyces invadans]